MLIDPEYLKSMPDVAQSQEVPFQSPLDFVGMENIEIPILLNNVSVPAKANVFVNVVDPSAKGIHMSRLYLTLKKAFVGQKFSYDRLKTCLAQSIESQNNLSSHARIQFSWQELLERKALISENSGWKSYPVEIDSRYDGKTMRLNLKFSILYSSTCPCSAALSRQLLQKDFTQEFLEDSSRPLDSEAVLQWLGSHRMATPHSQRSRADISLDIAGDFQLVKYVDALEACLKTPVQTAVKREDEQEFARLNGKNLMFVEDALRKMKQTLSQFSEVQDFSVKTSHFESLHAHDAVGFISKKSEPEVL